MGCNALEIEKPRHHRFFDGVYYQCEEVLNYVWFKRVVYDWDWEKGGFKVYVDFKKMRYKPVCYRCGLPLTEEEVIWFFRKLKKSGLKPKGKGNWREIYDGV